MFTKLRLAVPFVVFGLVIATPGVAVLQEGPDFSQSGIVTDKSTVHIGDDISFTVNAVNSSVTTATHIFVNNRIPDGTRYVDVTGDGAFPVVGDPSFGWPDEPLSEPVPAGYAYNLNTGELIPRPVDPGEVFSGGWFGDLSGGEEGTMQLTLRVTQAAEATITDLARVFDGEQLQMTMTRTVDVEDEEFSVYLPFLRKSSLPEPETTHVARTPEANWTLTASGASLADALDGSDVEIYEDDTWFQVVNSGPQDVFWPDNQYHVVRDAISFDLSDVPEGEIAEATLEVGTWGTSWSDGVVLRIHRGHWSSPLSARSWDAYGELLAAFDTSTTYMESKAYIPLPGLIGERTPFASDLRLMARGDEVTEMVLENRRATFLLRHWSEGHQLAYLHLEIQED
jgi:uncharacterized repeat protein (TIGR01451 family)